MSKKKQQAKPPRTPPTDYERAVEATRSFYSNAVAWGGSLLADARDQYSIDDATAAQLVGICVTAKACSDFRSESEGTVPPKVIDRNDSVMEGDDNPLLWLTDHYTPLMKRVSVSLLIWGKYFLRKVYNRAHIPVRLEWLNPLDVSPVIDWARQEVTAFQVRGQDRMLLPNELVYDFLFDPLNDFDGISAYGQAMRQIVGDRELVRFSQKYFQDGTMLGGMLTYEGDLSDEEYRKVKSDFEQFKGSQNAFKTFVAGGGVAKFDYKPMQTAPADLAMKDFKDALRSDICVAFGVNPILIGVGTANDPLSAQNTYEQIHEKFMLQQVVPRVRWVYRAFTDQWLKPDFGAWGDLRIEPDTSEIDAASKAAPDRSVTSVANAGRIWTLNEARDYTGHPTLDFPAIPINPDWATTVFDKGGITLNEYRAAIGFQPLPSAQDGLIYEIDPRAKALPAPQALSLSLAPPPAPEPMRQLAAGEPPIDAEVVTQPPIRSDPLLTKAQLYELDNWQKKVKRKGVETPFEVKHLSADIVGYVRTELGGLWNPNAVFGEARNAVRMGRSPAPMGATDDEATDYWRDYDAIQQELGADWARYMQGVSSVFSGILEQQPVDLAAAFTAHQPELMNDWVGTQQRPGALAQLMLAGMAAGQRGLDKEVSANPNKVRALGLDIAWNLASGEAFDFARSYAFDLIKDLDATTTASVSDFIQQMIGGTLTRPELHNALADILIPPGGTVTDAITRRAKMIGDTESLRAFNAGAVQRFKIANVTEATFQTARDGQRVCPICRGLYGTRANISVGWRDANGKLTIPPMHPLCRCFIRPFLGS